MQKAEKHRRSNGRLPIALPVRWLRPEGDVKMLQTENISACTTPTALRSWASAARWWMATWSR